MTKKLEGILFEVFDYDLSTQLSKGMKTDDLLGRASLNRGPNSYVKANPIKHAVA